MNYTFIDMNTVYVIKMYKTVIMVYIKYTNNLNTRPPEFKMKVAFPKMVEVIMLCNLFFELF